MSDTLFTIGYEGREVDELVAALREAGVERLVDVRELPLSRRPGFSKTRLAAALAEAGIEYEHVRGLGNPFRRSGRLDDYRRHLQEAQGDALAALAASLSTPTCLLCVEADPARCHRSVIAAALPGVAVTDL